MVLGAVVAWSTTGLFIRLLGLDTWTILFWRGLFGGIALTILLIWLYGRRAIGACRGMGAIGCLVGLCDAAVSITYIGALILTAVADVAVIYAAVPLATGALAWLWLRERMGPGTIAASLLAVGGVAITVWGAAEGRGLTGDLLAIVMTLLMAVMMVLIRGHDGLALVPAALLSALITTLVASPLASPIMPSTADLALLAFFGTVQMALALILFLYGCRYVSSAEGALLTCLEAPLAPAWVWLALGELPGGATFVGGGIVLVAVAGHLLAGLMQPPPGTVSPVLKTAATPG